MELVGQFVITFLPPHYRDITKTFQKSNRPGDAQGSEDVPEPVPGLSLQ